MIFCHGILSTSLEKYIDLQKKLYIDCLVKPALSVLPLVRDTFRYI